MAHAFDNRNFIPGKQQTFYSVVSPTSSSASRPDATNVLWEASSLSPKLASASPQASPKPNHPPPSYEESIFTKALANRHNSRSSLHSPSVRYYSNSPNAAAAAAPTSPLVSHSFPSTPNDLINTNDRQCQKITIHSSRPIEVQTQNHLHLLECLKFHLHLLNILLTE